MCKGRNTRCVVSTFTLVDCGEGCRCHRDGAGELFIWSVLYFIDCEGTNNFTLYMLEYTRVRTYRPTVEITVAVSFG